MWIGRSVERAHGEKLEVRRRTRHHASLVRLPVLLTIRLPPFEDGRVRHACFFELFALLAASPPAGPHGDHGIKSGQARAASSSLAIALGPPASVTLGIYRLPEMPQCISLLEDLSYSRMWSTTVLSWAAAVGLLPVLASADVLSLSDLSWTLRNQNGSIVIPGKVPSQAHLDLLDAGVITEPLLGINGLCFSPVLVAFFRVFSAQQRYRLHPEMDRQ